MAEKGYYLNSITLLDEAIGYYCASKFSTYSEAIRKHIEYFLQQDHQKTLNYDLTNSSKILVKILDEYSGSFLSVKEQSAKIDEPEKNRREKQENLFTKRVLAVPDFVLEMQRLGYNFKILPTSSKGQSKQSNPKKKKKQNERRVIKSYLSDILLELLKENKSILILRILIV